jgi:hypothetical protein
VFGCIGSTFSFSEEPIRNSAASVESPEKGLPLVAARDHTSALRRGLVGRFKAAIHLLITLPVASAVILLLNSLAELVYPGAAGLLLYPLAQAVLVIIVIARAQGKESSIGLVLSLLIVRLPRISWAYVRMMVGVYFWMLLSILCVSGSFKVLFEEPTTLGVAALLVGTIASAMTLNRMVNYSLVEVVAALPKETEPGCPLRRSTDLVNVCRRQTLVAGLSLVAFSSLIALVTENVIGRTYIVHHEHFGLSLQIPTHWTWLVRGTSALLSSVATLVSSAFWILFYIEAVKATRPSLLPFVPSDLVPPVES